jgi:hypothetical protein
MACRSARFREELGARSFELGAIPPHHHDASALFEIAPNDHLTDVACGARNERYLSGEAHRARPRRLR